MFAGVVEGAGRAGDISLKITRHGRRKSENYGKRWERPLGEETGLWPLQEQEGFRFQSQAGKGKTQQYIG